DDGQFVFEATGIIEYLEARFPETARLIPSDLPLAAELRMWDRFFDNYVSYPQGRLVFMAIGREPDDGKGGAAWKSMLETSYALLDPAARQSGVPGTISLEQIIGKRCFGEQRHKDVGRDDNKPGDSRVDGCDDFIAPRRAIEDGTRARAKRASSVLCVCSIEQNY